MPEAYENVVGNLYDKYATRNPIARALMAGFLRAFDDLVTLSGADQIFEVGCGEGNLSLRTLRRGIDTTGVDLEPDMVRQANAATTAAGFGPRFTVGDIYTIPRTPKPGLVVCCEVLEHLPDTREALEALASLASPWLLVSVPREPLWSAMNMARGQYWSRWGNTTGHLKQWSSAGFVRTIGTVFEVVEVRRPIPWTMVLARRR